MITQFVRCYIHPTNHTIDHVYCNDQGRQPELDPVSKQAMRYDIVDLTFWAESYIRPRDVKALLSYNQGTGVVTFTQRPTKALQDLNQVVNKREQPDPAVSPVREREGID